MSLDLLTTEKATMTVGVDDGSGTVTDLGLAFHWTLTASVISLDVVDGTIFATAVHEGSANLHVANMDGTLATDVAVTVTTDGAAPEPHLVVTFGAPQPK